jgi:hypothetical protein
MTEEEAVTARSVYLEAAREEMDDCIALAVSAAISARVVVEFLWAAWKAGKVVAKIGPMPAPRPEVAERMGVRFGLPIDSQKKATKT